MKFVPGRPIETASTKLLMTPAVIVDVEVVTVDIDVEEVVTVDEVAVVVHSPH